MFVRRTWRLSLAGLLGVVALLALTTNVFRSSRAVVSDALTGILASSPVELRLVVDVRADPAKVGDQYHHLNFRAGPGPLVRSAEARPALGFPFQLVLERRGVATTLRGDAIIRDGAGFVRFREMPAYGDLGRVLTGRWLQVGEPQAGSSGGFSGADRDLLVAAVTAPALAAVQRGPSERIRGRRARRFELRPVDERLRALLHDLPDQFPGAPSVHPFARFLEERLDAFRVDRMVLWVVPRSRDLVRFRAELLPRASAHAVQQLVLDATFTPAERASEPDIPRDAVRLRPETMEKLLRGPG